MADDNKSFDAKDFLNRSLEKAKDDKNVKYLGKQSDDFLEQANLDGLVNVFTGEQVKAPKQVKAIKDNQTPGEDGEITSPGINDTSVVSPSSITGNGIYQAEANSESYEVEKPGKANKTESVPGKKDVKFSAFNQWSLHNYVGGPFESVTGADYNAPLYTFENNEILRNPTASYLINTLKDKDLPAYQYNFADFALAKYYGKIPNNYMVTLRRFPMPVEDNIVSPNIIGPDGSKITKGMPDLARSVTWMDEATGNKLGDILKFDVNLAWKKVTSEMQTMTGNRGGAVGSKIANSGLLSTIYGTAQGMDAQGIQRARNGFDPVKGTYPNHVFGPINVVKDIMVRDQGLDFNQGFDLKFHYSLRQIGGVSPKIALLDLLSNLLVLTYNNGNFWGGATRGGGGANAMGMKPFGDPSKLKSGDFGGYLGSILGGAVKGAENIFKDFDFKNPGNIVEQFGNSALGKNLIGGGLMKLFGTPQGSEAVKAFITGDATGQWHVTVGNPLMPIAVIGNLICEKTVFDFGGEMSYEGFPTEMTMTVSLKPGRPRDKADIERMFNGGKERMYLTPEGGVNTNLNTNNSAYGNADNAQQADTYRKMTNG